MFRYPDCDYLLEKKKLPIDECMLEELYERMYNKQYQTIVNIVYAKQEV